MSDHSDGSPEESHDGTPSTGEEFESESTATRAEAAAVLRGLADGVDAGVVTLGTGEDALSAALPDEFEFEVEYERDDGEAEIEVELEWAIDEEPSEVLTESVEGSRAAGDERPDGDDRPAVETATVEAASEADAEPVADGESTGDKGWAEPNPAVESTAPVASRARFEVFRDRAEEWRWRLVHRNGNVIASSGEGYTRKHNAEKGMRSVMRNAPDADVTEE